MCKSLTAKFQVFMTLKKMYIKNNVAKGQNAANSFQQCFLAFNCLLHNPDFKQP